VYRFLQGSEKEYF